MVGKDPGGNYLVDTEGVASVVAARRISPAIAGLAYEIQRRSGRSGTAEGKDHFRQGRKPTRYEVLRTVGTARRLLGA